ncbi:uncharacterized protein LOC135501113 isoform X3 [Lineus longissimus]|uniref:uncharacterized protein LOC135501113 isoform X3 n=1 Tax=Lineus longissimus TaxID=88925 RepID=UPI00315DBF31
MMNGWSSSISTSALQPSLNSFLSRDSLSGASFSSQAQALKMDMTFSWLVIVMIYPAVIKEIGLIHKQLLRLMRANIPRRNVRISRDMPAEVFEEVRALVSTNSHKTTIKVTRATTTIAITSWEKVLVLFNFWAMETATPRNSLLRKVDGQGNSMMVVVNESHPMTLTMRHNANRLFVFASFEVKNKFGVAQ